MLVLLPYGLVPLLTAVLTLPSVLLWAAVAPEGKGTRISDPQFAAGLVLAGVLAMVAWFVGRRTGVRLAHRHRERLTAFLADPDRG